ncbi:MAG: hypothetical protein K0S33_967 [Bacteroidetes bacterium]|jgi:hypothetical protein|nr:hypothetical protein [Bacteroidota bacterium]
MKSNETGIHTKPRIRRWKKRLLISAGSILVFIVLLVALASPIAKYLLEKYDVKYTGREIKTDWALVNPLTGSVYLHHPKIYELNSDSLALSADGISANLDMIKLFSKTIDIGVLEINRPKWYIVQKDSARDLNFRDLIQRFSSDKTDTSSKGSSMHFMISSLKIKNGTFFYYENITPVNYYIKNVNISSGPIGWGAADTIPFNYSFLSGVKTGSMEGVFTINVKNLNYRLRADIVKYDLQVMEQYMKSFSNYGSFRAKLDAKIRSKGSLKDARDLRMKGNVVFSDMHFGKNPQEDYASFEKLSLGIKALYPGNNKYIFDTVSLLRPYFKYERYDHLDNFQMVFGKGGSNVLAVSGNNQRFNLILEIAKYVEKLATNFFRSYYKVNRVEISKARFVYEDYAINEKFSVATDSLFVAADSVDKNRKEVSVDLHSYIKPYGQIVIHLKVNPQDSSNFDMQYSLEKFPLAMFNPYLVTYTSYPLNRGTMEIKGNWKVRDGQIQSNNHLIIVDPRIAKRVKNKENKWIPLPLIMPLIREQSNVIDYEIPITGKLKKPKLHPKDAIIDFLKNIVINPATTPYRMEVRKTEKEIEKAQTLHWETGQVELSKGQKKFVNRAAEFLEENPAAHIYVYPIEYTDKEKEHILFFEAKKKYYLLVNKMKYSDFTEKDSIRVTEIALRDSFFMKQLERCCNKSLDYTIQAKCTTYIGKGLVEKKYARLQKQRRNAFIACFKENNSDKQVKMQVAKKDIPYNGFSYYKIKYKGEIPENLAEAYEKMNDFNNEAPRVKYKNKRKKSTFTR